MNMQTFQYERCITRLEIQEGDTYGCAVFLHRVREFMALCFTAGEETVLAHVEVEAT